MADSLIAYIERLELLTFFSGYPLIFSIVHFIIGNRNIGNRFSNRLVRSLPLAYALSGSIFFLLWVREMIIRSGIKNIAPDYAIAPLKIWAILAVFFWMPALAKRPVLSLFHSLVFFAVFFLDLVSGFRSVSGNDMISNDMKVYSVSLILNILCLILILAGFWVFPKMFSRR